MRLIGLMTARNEAWVIGASLRAALRWCDAMVVLDHASTDYTRWIVEDVAEDHPGRIHLLTEADPTWNEMEHRQRTLDFGRAMGGTHFAIVDADEILTGNFLDGIRGQIEHLQPGGHLQVGMPCMWRSLDRYRVGQSIWANRFDLCVAFADAPGLCWAKHNGASPDHHARAPRGSQCVARAYGTPGGVMHLQFAPWRRLVAKHALYKVMERVKYPLKPVDDIERMYNLAPLSEGSDLQVAEALASWWEPYANIRRFIDLDAEPWQEAEVRRIVGERGLNYFIGLNLFGVEREAVASR